MITPSTYQQAIKLLLESKQFSFKVRKDLRTGAILGIEVDFAPIMRDTGKALMAELLGGAFTYEYLTNDNNYILVKLK